MKRLVFGFFFLAGFLVLLFLAFFQDESGEPAAPPPGNTGPAAERSSPSGPRPAPLDVSSGNPSASREPVAGLREASERNEDFFGWTGTVLLPDGRPAEGARVLARSSAQRAWTQADEQGSFRLPWRKEEGFPSVEIWPEKPGFCAEILAESPGRPATKLTLHLRDALIPVLVHVVDNRDDSPVEGVRVLLQSPPGRSSKPWVSSATSDREGRARLHAPHAGPLQLGTGPNPVARAVESSNHLLKEGAGSLELTLRVRVLPTRIQLLARDAVSGQTLEDAVFQIARQDGSGRVLPSNRGLLDFRVPEKDRQAQILVQAPGHDPREVFLPEEAADVVPVDLPALETHPVLVTRGGRPTGPFVLEWSWTPALVFGPFVVQAGMASFWDPSKARIRGQKETERDGSGELPVPTAMDGTPQPLFLTVRSPSGSVERVFPDFLGSEMPESGGRWLIELRSPTARVIVEVTGDDGAPFPGAQVTVSVSPQSKNPLRFRPLPGQLDWKSRVDAGEAGRAITGADGKVVFDRLAPGRLVWQVRQGSWERHGEESELLQPGEERLVRVVRHRALDLSGLVIGAGGKPPGKGVHVTVEKAAGEPSKWRLLNPYVRLASDGSFLVKGLDPGRYRIAARSGPSILNRLEVEFPATREVRLELLPTRDLAVLVVDARTGDPVPQATVEAASTLGARKEFTDPQGKALLADLPELATSLKVTAPAHAVWIEDYPAGPPPEGAELRVELNAGRTLIVEVELPEGVPNPAAAWRLEELPPDHPAQRSIQVLGGGKEVFLQGVPIHALTLRAFDAQGQPLDPPLKIPAGTLGQRLTWSPAGADSR